jgi:hypothetical protein
LPFGVVADVVPSEYNSNFITIVNGNQLQFSTHLTGLFQIAIYYNMSAITSFTCPHLVFVSGNLDILGADLTGTATSVATGAVTASPYVAHCVLYVRLKGGLTGNLMPTVQVQGLTSSGAVYAASYMSVMSVPTNMLTDPFP